MKKIKERKKEQVKAARDYTRVIAEKTRTRKELRIC